MKRILAAWIGNTDLRAADGELETGLGPIGQAVLHLELDHLLLLNNYPPERAEKYIGWIRKFENTSELDIRVQSFSLKGPTEYGEIYEAAKTAISNILNTTGTNSKLTFHLSPGTPAMSAVWIILAKTRFPAELIESSVNHGIRNVVVPFDLSAEFIPDIAQVADERLRDFSAAAPPLSPAFDQIVHQSAVMKTVIAQARLAAARDIPVLIEGESGTGKELFARAIHFAGSRAKNPLVAINCGAIPADLVESQLFGHIKGAFTGASSDKKGFFEIATEGSIFLDEVGELPLPAQVKLLRVLQEGEIMPVGASSATFVNVRVIAATNRDLLEEINKGRFREDLFYRLAVAVLRLPALRDRSGDIGILADQLWKDVNAKLASDGTYRPKRLLPSAKQVLLGHHWRGNVRELQNTLVRLAVFSSGTNITPADVKASIMEYETKFRSPLEHAFSQGFNLEKILEDVKAHYLERALRETGGNKSKAARLLGLRNYQTLDNWLAKIN